MISKILDENENVVCRLKSNPQKTSTQFLRIILINLVLILFYYVLFFASETRDINWVLCLSVLFLISIASVYALIYNLLLKNKTKNQSYYITDRRIIMINKDRVIFNYIDKINIIGIAREKGNFGDISFYFNVDIENGITGQITNTEDVKSITFSGVEYPRNLVQLIKKYTKEPNSIYVYDDRINIIGRKI